MHRRRAAICAGTGLACAALAAPAAAADLRVAVRSLQIDHRTVRAGHLPGTVRRGAHATFALNYIVRGPKRTASAFAEIALTHGRWKYTIDSDRLPVRPGIWRWSVTDSLPKSYPAGTYTAVVRIELSRATKTIAGPVSRAANVRFT